MAGVGAPRVGSTSSGLLLLLVGTVLLAAFVNGALPRLLETLFSAAPPGAVGAASAAVPTGVKPGPTIGAAATGTSA